jgi:hypothetical protein
MKSESCLTNSIISKKMLLLCFTSSSPEWQAVPAEEKETLGLTFSHDGEFW